jgi:O-antigen ligase
VATALTSWYRDLRDGNHPPVNRRFTWLVFATPPIGGSAVSFLYNGGAVWCAMEVARGRAALSRAPQILAMTAVLYALCAALIVAALINPGPLASLADLIGLGSFLIFPFSYAVWRLSGKEAIVEACIMGCVFACLGALALAVLQVHLLSESRGEGGAGNSLVFAGLVSLATGVTLAGVFRYRGRRQLTCLVAYAAGVLAIVYSSSRGPLVVLLAHAIIVALVYSSGRRVQLVAVTIGAVGALLALLIFTDLTPLGDRIAVVFDDWKDVVEDGNYNTSLGLRFAVWDVGIQLFLEKPIFGHGAGNLSGLIRQELLSEYGISRGFSHFHNVFINTAVEGGVVALAALLAAICLPVVIALRTLFRSDVETERFGATLLLLYFSMFVIAGMTNLVLRHDIMDAMFMISLITGLLLVVERPAAAPTEPG